MLPLSASLHSLDVWLEGRRQLSCITLCRLIAALFDLDRNCLSTCCSAPISVLSNNDAPHGPASIQLELAISDGWVGWPEAEKDRLSVEEQPWDPSSDSEKQSDDCIDDAGPSSKSSEILELWHLGV